MIVPIFKIFADLGDGGDGEERGPETRILRDSDKMGKDLTNNQSPITNNQSPIGTFI
jgi:hypothetical protein